jgi:uncharacterized membrane protein
VLKYLILVVQNSLGTSILLATLCVVAARFGGGQRRRKWLACGFAAGAASALILAVFKSTTVLVNREYWNIGILSVSIAAGILFFPLLWGALKKKSPELHEKAYAAVAAVLAASLLLYCLPGVFLYPTEFALTGESIFGTDFLFRMIGYLCGLAIAALSGLALYKAGTGLRPALARILLAAGLAVNMANQASTIVQFLLARRIIPMSKWLFALIKPAINYNEYFLYAIMALTILLPAVAWAKSLHPSQAYANPAQHRRIRAASRRQRRWCAVAAAGYVMAVLSLTVVKAYDGREIALSPAEPINIVGGEIVIPLENVSDGHLHRFAYIAANGVEVRFIVIKKNAAAFGVGLDACDICGATGYYERDDEVICKLCDVVMNKSTIGFKGGCNPVPLAYALKGGGMSIQTQSLENEVKRFQ